VPGVDAGDRGARLGRSARARGRELQGVPPRPRAPEASARRLQRHALARGIQPGDREDHGSRGISEDLDPAAPLAGGIRRCILKRLLVLVLGLVLTSAYLPAQDTAKLEADAKKAFDSGRFKEAGDKYAKAAATAGRTPDRTGALPLPA